jgi:hypothetical protein
MRYTAFAAILFGIVSASYAAFHYASGAPQGETESPSTASLAIPIAFAACLVIGGLLMWVFTGKRYSESKGNSARRPVRAAGILPTRDAKHDSPRG